MKRRSQRGQSEIINWAADGEVIEALKGIGLNAEEVVKDVVEVAADSGRTDPGGQATDPKARGVNCC